ncbi:endo-1,3-alpha-glucanase family glycosylhydrolase [Burkholderia sp. DN3021]|uniref:endo-1,3-alpha-glucanase family glycosylhydrolase n=1 Tax=Burkholderia sp. DN3021 TaxID=3410137 RepID=UPI003C7A9F39
MLGARDLLRADAARASAVAGGRMVFAHYMVAWPRGGKDAGPEQYAREMRDAMDTGIDGFALNCGGWHATEPYYKRRVATIYDAADRFDGAFRLFVSADGHAQDELSDILQTVSGRRAQWRVDGRPVLSAYALGGRDAIGARAGRGGSAARRILRAAPVSSGRRA